MVKAIDAAQFLRETTDYGTYFYKLNVNVDKCAAKHWGIYSLKAIYKLSLPISSNVQLHF